jgi:hypothetical protein
MSSYYRTFNEIKMVDLFDGRLDNDSKDRVIAFWTFPNEGYLTDGKGDGMRVRGNELVNYFEGYSEPIARRICEVFSTTFHSDSDPQYYGFLSNDEMESYNQQVRLEEAQREAEAEQERKRMLYQDVISFLKMEKHSLNPKGKDMTLALMAHQLVTEDSSLLEPLRHEELFFKAEKLLSEKDVFETSCPF